MEVKMGFIEFMMQHMDESKEFLAGAEAMYDFMMMKEAYFAEVAENDRM